MESKKYIEQAKRTESTDLDIIAQRLQSKEMIRVLHAAMGVVTESAELLDAVKKHVYYGKPLDKVNLFEEVGDLFWYLAILADELGFDFESAMSRNIEKLKARYGEKFSETSAIHRNLEVERNLLERAIY